MMAGSQKVTNKILNRRQMSLLSSIRWLYDLLFLVLFYLL